ncbi:cytochrome b [Mycolicibacterium baixiangningiae]|uniref:cytochrome b n=1 Tax=Mycolicibacterium baixiangningiae TaxID=2761578 RepID=UPI001866B040|nr:cytochrome b/b6 domain-containing protein [Mycolicibacterium baixiangningiae]
MVVVAGVKRLRNGEHGYGVVTKVLHWLTVIVVAAQFGVGWSMEADDAVFDREKDRIDALEDTGEDRAEQQGEAAEERFEAELDRLDDELDAREDGYVADAASSLLNRDGFSDGLSLPEMHVLLGVSLILLALTRVIWRRMGGLPPWADHLGAGERRFEATLEKMLLTMLFMVPATGLILIAGGEHWLILHIAAQVVFLAVIAAHVGLILKHTVVRRNRHLSRML